MNAIADVEQLLLAVAQARRPSRRRAPRAGRTRSSGRPRRRGPASRRPTSRDHIEPWCSCPARIRFSRTVSCGKTCSSWKVRPTPSRLSSQGRMPVIGAPVDAHFAGRGRQLAEDAVEQRRLARAVRPDQAEDLAFAHVEGDAVDGADAAEGLRQVAHLEDRAHGIHRFLQTARRARAAPTGRTPSAPSPRSRRRSGRAPRCRSASTRAAAPRPPRRGTGRGSSPSRRPSPSAAGSATG